VLSFRVARCFGRSSHNHYDDLVHLATISATAHSGTGISVCWDGPGAARVGPDRLARGMVALRFSLLTLMPWAAYFGLAAVIVSVLALVIGLSRLDRRGIALALVALIGGGLIAYVP